MSTVLTSLEQYLHTSYEPDREYVDGVVVERTLAERPHSLSERNVVYWFAERRYRHFQVWPNQRLNTVPGRRYRIPDICVTLEDPGTDIFDTPPFLCIEILSSNDQMRELLDKLDEY